MAQLRLPQNAEQRGHRFLALAFEAEARGRALGPGPVAGFGAGTEAEFDRVAARGRSELEMRHLVQQDISLGFGA